MPTQVSLYRRHLGVYKKIRSTTIESNVVLCKEAKDFGDDEYDVDEDALLEEVSAAFTIMRPETVLLLVEDAYGASAVTRPKRFRRWSKYFDAFAITVRPTEWIYAEPNAKSSRSRKRDP